MPIVLFVDLAQQMPPAEAFMDWVTSEVMPSIRNTARLEDAKKRKEDLVKSHADSANIFEDPVMKHADSVNIFEDSKKSHEHLKTMSKCALNLPLLVVCYMQIHFGDESEA